MDQNKEDEEIKSQSMSVSSVMSFVFIEGAKAILGYIAVYFFTPVWRWLVKWWKKEDTPE